MSVRTRSVGLIILCQVLGMTLWFSASAAIPNLITLHAISGQQAALLTGAVQMGFVAGTLVSAVFGIADRFDPRRIFAASAGLGAVVNLGLLASGFDGGWTVLLRFLTGACMAGVYPVGMKLAAGWSHRRIGLMIGALVGALTLGSALPHLFNAFRPLDWRIAVTASSACAVAGALAIGLVSLGPHHGQARRFHPAAAVAALRRRSIRLVNLGYLGHMWELYAMWAWIGPFITWVATRGEGPTAANVALMTFAIVGAGAAGAVAAGAIADRLGRTTVAIVAMIASAACAASIGLVSDYGLTPVLAVALVWGVAVIADSAQFSAAVAELAEPSLVGTMLTIQTCLGFLLTVAAIQLMPVAVAALGWRYAFTVLAIGPLLGALAMWRVRGEPDSLLIANGRK